MQQFSRWNGYIRRAREQLQCLNAGGTHVPAVRHLVERATGIAPHSGLDPELCVALGAGMQVQLCCVVLLLSCRPSYRS